LAAVSGVTGLAFEARIAATQDKSATPMQLKYLYNFVRNQNGKGQVADPSDPRRQIEGK
jgi:hypothetical protein